MAGHATRNSLLASQNTFSARLSDRQADLSVSLVMRYSKMGGFSFLPSATVAPRTRQVEINEMSRRER